MNTNVTSYEEIKHKIDVSGLVQPHSENNGACPHDEYLHKLTFEHYNYMVKNSVKLVALKEFLNREYIVGYFTQKNPIKLTKNI